MARFTLKKSRTETVETDADTVVIGSRTTCNLTLDDPMAAEEHCVVIAAADGFMIEDLATTSGTYLNGTATRGRTLIPDGAEVVIGVTRLHFGFDREAMALTITVGKVFFFDRIKDPLEWSRTEVGFGRFRALGIGNWAIVASLLLIFPLCLLVGPTSDSLLNAGPLFHGAQLEGWVADLADLPEDDRGCEACHDPFGGTPTSRCAACHEDIMVGHHPFTDRPDDWQRECVYCHVEHLGESGGLISRTAVETCTSCHEERTEVTGVRGVEVSTVGVPLAFVTFSHAVHKDKTACSDCHALAEADDPAVAEGGRPREFRPLVFESCMGCHAGDATHPKKSEKIFEVLWHGAEEDPGRCTQCHVKRHEKELKQVPGARQELTYTLETRSHAEQAASLGDLEVDGCATCHRNGAELRGARRLESLRFDHRTHFSDLGPPETLELTARKNGECSRCHRQRVDSTTLVVREHRYEGSSCGECHGASRAASGLSEVAARTTEARDRNDFPHDRHRGVPGGCFACHKFDAPSGAAELPVTPAVIRDCSACHKMEENVAHQNVGGGSCHECHKAGDPVYRNEPVLWERPTDVQFRHLSPGHIKLTSTGDCMACHPQPTWDARTLREVPVPNERDTGLCRACHVGRMERFHFK